MNRQFVNIVGRRADIGEMFFHSKMEANYARYLKMLKKIGAIDDWEYEPETFWFLEIKRGVRSYKPDFRVKYKFEETPTYIEVKGYMDPRSKTKIARFKKYYPAERLEIVGAREYNAIRTKWSRTIRNWE